MLCRRYVHWIRIYYLLLLLLLLLPLLCLIYSLKPSPEVIQPASSSFIKNGPHFFIGRSRFLLRSGFTIIVLHSFLCFVPSTQPKSLLPPWMCVCVFVELFDWCWGKKRPRNWCLFQHYWGGAEAIFKELWLSLRAALFPASESNVGMGTNG